MIMNEVTIFAPNARSKEATIMSPVANKVVDALQERLGKEAAQKAASAFRTMKRNDIEFLQFRLGDRRIRVKQVEHN